MQKKNSGVVSPIHNAVDQAAQKRHQAIGAAQQMQAGFFTLRTQLFNTFIGQGQTLDVAFENAHQSAKRDFFVRFEEAAALLELMGETIEPAPLESLLRSEDK